MTVVALHKAQVYTDTLYRNNRGDYTYGEKYFQVNKHFGFAISGPKIPQRKFKPVVDMLVTAVDKYLENVTLDKLDFTSEIPASDFSLLIIKDTLVLEVLVLDNELSAVTEHSIYDDVVVGSATTAVKALFNLIENPKLFGIRSPNFLTMFSKLITDPALFNCGGEIKVYTPGEGY